jgi:glycosyltransferase involved in cell wall biosynthesis
MRFLAVCELDLGVRDGSVIHFIELMRNLVKLDHDVHIFAPKITKWHDKSLSMNYVPCVFLKSHSFLPKILLYTTYQLFLFFYLIHFVKKTKVDVIYSRLGMFSLAPVVVSKITKIPHIVEVNGVIGEELKMVGVPRVFVKSFEFVEKHIYKFSQRIITVTKNIKKELIGKYALSEKKIIVVPNGANTDLFRPLNIKRAKKELDLDDKSFHVIFVGYLVQWQGVDRLINAAPFVLKEVPNTKFIIVGEGRILNALKAQVEELNITDKFIFTGKVPYEVIPLYINACDVCAAPFIRERNEKIGLSAIKVYEYLACGKPVVASNIEGVGDLLEISKSGIPVEPGNCEDLGGGIVKLLEDKKLRDGMGKNGRKLVEEKYSWHRAAKDVVRVCEEVVLN